MKKTLLLSTISSTFLTIIILSFLGFKASSKSQILNTSEIGSILVWPGKASEIPSGWVLCDGRDLLKRDYSKLYSKLSTLWNTDEGTSKDFFRVPDLRGVFVRGVNGSRKDKYRDEALKNRKRLAVSSSYGTNDPGSFQIDWFEEHNHGGGNHDHGDGSHIHGISTFDGDASGNETGSDSGNKYARRVGQKTHYSGRIIERSGNIIDKSGGNETRPKNAYVHFIVFTGVN